VWKNNRRRHEEQIPTWQVLRTYGPDYKAIFVGDGAMSPYEITMPGGSVEHWNEEAGTVWIERLTGHYRRAAWLNPTPKQSWGHVRSITMINDLMEGRMFPLTVNGIDEMTRELSR
jgi:uncharacterized protein with von Willebrand factor type A (vWA) domain